MNRVINVSGIDITIEKKKIKNMYLRILPPDGQVKVTAPRNISDEEIEKFIFQKIQWIDKKRKHFVENPDIKEKKYDDGEMHYLWGETHELAVMFSEGENEVWVQEGKIFLKVKKDSTVEFRKKLLERWYRDVLALKIKLLLPKCIEIVGKAPAEWHIKDMKTRWGTCNIQKKRIWLNLQLVKQPEECLEYVIIHELVHLYEKSHNEVFKAYMDRFCPDWRSIKKKLRIDL